MALLQADYKGNTNIGFYGIVTDAYSLFAHDFKRQDTFPDPRESYLGGTNLLGLFGAGNSNTLIVPDLVTDHEQELFSDAEITVHVLDGRYTALGNLILCNDHGAVISPHLADRADEIGDALDVPTAVSTVAGLDIPGSCGVATNNGVLLHRDASEEELETVEQALHVDGDIGSINFGSPYVHSGVLANSSDLMVGNDTTGPEIQRVQDALGFLRP